MSVVPFYPRQDNSLFPQSTHLALSLAHGFLRPLLGTLTFSLCSCSLLTRASSCAFLLLRASMRASHWATRQASNSTLFSCMRQSETQAQDGGASRPVCGAAALPRGSGRSPICRALWVIVKQLGTHHCVIAMFCFKVRWKG